MNTPSDVIDEFELIARYFAPLCAEREDILCGIGDDAALLVPERDKTLAIAVDTLVEGVHFPPGFAPSALGYRVAAVNLSDLAAVAATPRYATLALTLPRVEERWLADFAEGLRAALAAADCALVGGDTTRGPLSITLQVIGVLDGPALRRDAGRDGDLVVVSGTLGDARAALDILDQAAPAAAQQYLLERYARPTPRLELARALANFAHAAIDVSDGLVADLGHIARASKLGIRIERDALPLSAALLEYCGRERALDYATSGGDDYELVVTIPPAALAAAQAAALRCAVRLSVIGRTHSGQGVSVHAADGTDVSPQQAGYRHFA